MLKHLYMDNEHHEYNLIEKDEVDKGISFGK
jgi:hypothetical protein